MKRLFRFIWALAKYLLVGKTVSEEIYQNRITVCNNCTFLKDNKCTVCGCNVKVKAKWDTEVCPKNKW